MNKWSIADHLTNYLSREKLGHSKHPTLWPSEASAIIKNKWGEEEVVGKCRRATFFRYATHSFEFYPELDHLRPLVQELKTKAVEPERYLRWIWEAGKLFEEQQINLSKSCGIYVEDQVRVFIKEYNLSGSMDLIIVNPQTYAKSIVEIKSVYSFGGNQVMGTPYERRVGVIGVPRDSNLMQIALYDWFFAQERSDFEHSRLLYGDRGTGRDAEFGIETKQIEDTIHIFYWGISPNYSKKILSPITINSIINDGYQYIIDHLMAGTIPPRDFELEYSQERIKTLYDRDLVSEKKDQKLTKKERERIEKIEQRKVEDAERIKNGKNPLKPLKPVTKGDWHCQNCKFIEVCYNTKDNSPRNI